MPHAGPAGLVAGDFRAPRTRACTATIETRSLEGDAARAFGHAFHRSLVLSHAHASLAARLAGVRVPVRLAHASARRVPPGANGSD